MYTHSHLYNTVLLHDGHLGGVAADKPRYGFVYPPDAGGGVVGRLVAADAQLEVEVGPHGGVDGVWDQGGASVVEVEDGGGVAEPRGVGACRLDQSRV